MSETKQLYFPVFNIALWAYDWPTPISDDIFEGLKPQTTNYLRPATERSSACILDLTTSAGRTESQQMTPAAPPRV